MNPDLTVIRRHGRYSVLAHSQPVRLKDGNVIDLHLVQQDSGHPDDRFLRAVLDHHFIKSHIVDVRDLARCLDAEIRTAHERDAGDLVVLTLRQFYPDAAGLLTKIVEESLAKLLPPTHFVHGTSDQADMFGDQGAERRWAVEVGEVNKVTPAEAEALKRFVTTGLDRLRRQLYSTNKEA